MVIFAPGRRRRQASLDIHADNYDGCRRRYWVWSVFVDIGPVRSSVPNGADNQAGSGNALDDDDEDAWTQPLPAAAAAAATAAAPGYTTAESPSRHRHQRR